MNVKSVWLVFIPSAPVTPVSNRFKARALLERYRITGISSEKIETGTPRAFAVFRPVM